MKTNRRNFFRQLTCGTAGLAMFNQNYLYPLPVESRLAGSEISPTQAQKAWMKLGFGMFIHFGINTYYDKEWSDGTLDISAFNPQKLDTDQWCKVAKDAGMRYIVIVTKHHDGFCLWPTKHTEYNVKNTPYKKDIIEKIVNSAKKYGLKTGFYYSLWDEHEPSHFEDENAYVGFMKNQLYELMTQYGDIVELWFDGFWKKQQSGWKNQQGERPCPEEFITSWRYEGAFRWQIDHLYHFVKEQQPDCIVMNNPTSVFKGVPLFPVDAVCAERGVHLGSYKKTWNWLGKEVFMPLQIETTMSTKGNKKFPKGNWFWHEWDHSVASASQINGWLKSAGKLGANLLLNCGPRADGQLRPEDIASLSKMQNPNKK